jgi:hypothetical protein
MKLLAEDERRGSGTRDDDEDDLGPVVDALSRRDDDRSW